METWKLIEGYGERYSVSSLGRVRSNERLSDIRGHRLPERILKPVYYSAGYPAVTLTKNGKQKRVAIHILVCTAFHGPPPTPEHEVCHWDDVKTNNHVSNLRWGTRADNVGDMARNGNNYRTNLTHCLKGHPFSPENTWRRSDGTRECYTCRLDRKRKYNAKKRKTTPATVAA